MICSALSVPHFPRKSDMFVQVRGASSYLYTGGKAFDRALPALLFVHGAQNDHSVWCMQTRWMAHHGFSVITPDLPAHGQSGGQALPSIQELAEWCVDLLDALEVDRVAWIGHSMGSLIALDAAARFSERSWANVLMGSAFPMRVSDALLHAADNDEAQAFDMITRWSHTGIHHYPGSPGPGFSIYNQARRLMERQAKGVLAVDFRACHNYADGAERAREIRQPTLLLCAERDAMTPPRAARSLLETIHEASMIQIASAGHQMMVEQPDAVRRALANFLHAHRPNREIGHVA